MGKLIQAFAGNYVTTIAGVGIVLGVVAEVLQGGELDVEKLTLGLAGMGLMAARDGGTGSNAKA